MVEPLDQLKTVLKENGQSLTKGRQTVFAALQHQEPQTMQQIVKACAGKADRASVYRTIALFERIGIVKRLQIGWKYKLELSDAFHRHHHHLTCRHCGRVIPLAEDSWLEQRLKALAEAQNFEMQDHQVEIEGICQVCRQAKKS